MPKGRQESHAATDELTDGFDREVLQNAALRFVILDGDLPLPCLSECDFEKVVSVFRRECNNVCGSVPAYGSNAVLGSNRQGDPGVRWHDHTRERNGIQGAEVVKDLTYIGI